MTLGTLLLTILVLAVVGFVVWLVTQKVPMDPTFKIVIYVVVVIFLVLWLLQTFGLLGALSRPVIVR